MPDPLAHFARAHLRTAAQRAVYRTVGSNPDSWWTGSEIAGHTGFDPLDIARILRGFAAAGILHEQRRGQGRRYRWHDDVRYVLDGTTPRGAMTDPVCGMPVRADSPHLDTDAEGATVRFCSRFCQLAFRSHTTTIPPQQEVHPW